MKKFFVYASLLVIVEGIWDNEKRMLGKIKGLPLHSWKGKV